MWHASVAAHGLPLGPATLERRARAELDGVGDAELGEWTDWTGRAFHLRRRLSASEEAVVGPVIDIRRTEEARRRAGRLGSRIIDLLPAAVLADEIGVLT